MLKGKGGPYIMEPPHPPCQIVNYVWTNRCTVESHFGVIIESMNEKYKGLKENLLVVIDL
jgi:hypothetical protein